MADTKKFLDAEGVKHLWSKINMQDYPNNETLMSVIEAIDETKADKTDLQGLATEEYVNNMISQYEIATDDEIIDMLIEEDILAAVIDSDGVLADENNNILLW